MNVDIHVLVLPSDACFTLSMKCLHCHHNVIISHFFSLNSEWRHLYKYANKHFQSQQQIKSIITWLIVINIGPLTGLFCNCPLFCNCLLGDL